MNLPEVKAKWVTIVTAAVSIMFLLAGIFVLVFLPDNIFDRTPTPIRVSEKNEVVEVTINYTTTGVRFVDNDIAEFVASMQSAFTARAEEDYAEYQAKKDAGDVDFKWRPYQIGLYGTTTAVTKKGVSVAFSIATYTGGANIMQEWATALYDRHKKRRIPTEEFFARDDTGGIANSLSWLSKTAIDHFETQYQDIDFFAEGFSPTIGNFRSLAFSQDGSLMVYFDKYQIAPGSFGTSAMKIVPENLKGIVSPDLISLFALQ